MKTNTVNVIFDFKVTPMSIGPFIKKKNKKIYTQPKYRGNQFKYKNLMHNQQIYWGKTFLNNHDVRNMSKTQPNFWKKPKVAEVEIVNPYEIFGEPPKEGT